MSFEREKNYIYYIHIHLSTADVLFLCKLLFPIVLDVASNVNVFRVSSSSLRITWSPPSNIHCFADDLQYKVLYNVHIQKFKNDPLLSSDSNPESWLDTPDITIDGLQEGTIYKASFTIVSNISTQEKESQTRKCILHIGPELDGKIMEIGTWIWKSDSFENIWMPYPHTKAGTNYGNLFNVMYHIKGEKRRINLYNIKLSACWNEFVLVLAYVTLRY